MDHAFRNLEITVARKLTNRERRMARLLKPLPPDRLITSRIREERVQLKMWIADIESAGESPHSIGEMDTEGEVHFSDKLVSVLSLRKRTRSSAA